MHDNPLKDIFSLFFPPRCAVCGDVLPDGSGFMCAECRWQIPLTNTWLERENPVARRFYGHVPVENACAFFRFVHRSGFRDMVHRFKYGGGWLLAEKMGRWFGSELASSPLYGGIDLIVPVPLHLRRTLRRGYNQSEYIARGMSASMGVAVDSRSVVRSRYNESQARRSREERWENVEGIFSVRDAEALRGRHILLVDDVLTTGATVISCAEAILRSGAPAAISVAVLAATDKS